MTAKQAAAQVREHLKTVASGKRITWTPKDDEPYQLSVPAGLRFDVRATPKGNINVTIHDAGYVDAVTNGDRRLFFGDGKAEPIVEAIREYERTVWGEELGKVEWGPVFIFSSAGPTKTSRIGGDAA